MPKRPCPSVLSLLAATFVASLAQVALAAPTASGPPSAAHPPRKTALLAPARKTQPGRSVGSPTEGKLVGGAHLAEGAHVRVVPQYATGDVRWGLEPLVGMLDRAAKSVRRQFPDAVMSVGHLSKAGGGEIDHHASHESGRDADVGFYVLNHLGKPVYADHFVPFVADGTSRSWPGAHFDDAKNWALVTSLVTDPQARVTHLFVATPLRARLLAYAEKIGAPPAVRQRAAEVMAQPHGALPHDDHFHVRIACPAGMEKCIEQPMAKRSAKKSGHAVASNAHGAHPSGHGPHHAPGATPTRPHAPSTRSDAKTAPKPEPKEEEASAKAEKSESIVPSLAPIVPGLDAAVIAAPLNGPPKDVKPEERPAERPVDDPDGVLE